MRIRKNDLVKVIAGKDKGKTGKVLEVLREKEIALSRAAAEKGKE